MAGPDTNDGGNNRDSSGYALFDTAIGRCGVAWRDDAIVAVQLPEPSETLTRSRLLSKLDPSAGASAPTQLEDRPVEIQRGIEAMIALLDGQGADLSFITVDLDGSSAFERSVYDVTRAIGPGDSLTYGQVAAAVGEPGAAQAVGKALGANPIPVVVPCHRVLGANGKLTGFSASGGVDTKRRMLLIEGCPAVAPSLFD